MYFRTVFHFWKMQEEQFNKRRLTGSYITSVVSISLVLFALGLFGIIILNAQRLSELIRENIGFEIIIKEGVKEAAIVQLQKTLDANPNVKSTQYISREEATQRLIGDLGEDFIQWLGEGENPLLPTIEVRFKADWANPDSLEVIEKHLLKNKDIKEVYYQKSLVHLVNDNIRRISAILLVFSGLLLLIAIALINNTIRLSVYSKRFIIRSMQLVGATESFIRKPFIITGLVQGFLGSLLALTLLGGIIYISIENIPELVLLHDLRATLLMFGIVSFTGMMLTAISTYFALNKYLRIRTDKLFV